MEGVECVGARRGGKVSVSGAVPGFASLGVQIFGNGRVGPNGMMGWRRVIINCLGSRWLERAGGIKIFRYFYFGLAMGTSNRNRAHGLMSAPVWKLEVGTGRDRESASNGYCLPSWTKKEMVKASSTSRSPPGPLGQDTNNSTNEEGWRQKVEIAPRKKRE